MEVSRAREHVYSDTELDRVESQAIEDLKSSATEPISDPDAWLDEELSRNILLTTADWPAVPLSSFP